MRNPGKRSLRTQPSVASVALLATLATAFVTSSAVARELDRRVVTFGETRQEIKSKPVTERPNRPLHVYGNTVRRRAHR